jgi:NitT/TauT family transport system ATP-binding protein
LVLTPHPGRVRAELNSGDFGFNDLDAPGFGTLKQKINNMLFEART